MGEGCWGGKNAGANYSHLRTRTQEAAGDASEGSSGAPTRDTGRSSPLACDLKQRSASDPTRRSCCASASAMQPRLLRNRRVHSGTRAHIAAVDPSHRPDVQGTRNRACAPRVPMRRSDLVHAAPQTQQGWLAGIGCNSGRKFMICKEKALPAAVGGRPCAARLFAQFAAE
jgi:hypothetical protein